MAKTTTSDQDVTEITHDTHAQSDCAQSALAGRGPVSRRALTFSLALGLGLAAGAFFTATRASRAANSPAFERQDAVVRRAESEVGNVVADALREMTSAEIALVPAAIFKGDPGRVGTADAALAALDTPSDTVVVLRVKGAQVRDALERSLSYAGKPFAGFLQVSGLKVRYDSRKPVGQRVAQITVAGAPLDPAKLYKVAMPRPLADGQQGYFEIWTPEQIVTDSGKSLADALNALPKSRGAATVDGRIVAIDR